MLVTLLRRHNNARWEEALAADAPYFDSNKIKGMLPPHPRFIFNITANEKNKKKKKNPVILQ